MRLLFITACTGPVARTALLGLSSLVLTACGGSLSATDPALPGGVPDAVPTSGAYTWVLKPTGAASAPRYGLSLIHPTAPTIEQVIEPASAALTDVKLLSAGALDIGAARVTDLRPQALLYLAAGDLRQVPLVANGNAPQGRVQRAQAINLCRFLVDGQDHVQVFNSRFIVSTAGSDGRCDSADDGFAEVSFSATGLPKVNPGNGAAPLALARDPVSLAPRAWVYANRVEFWATGTANAVSTVLRAAGQTAFSSVLLATPRNALADDGERLNLLEFRNDVSVGVRALDSASTAGGAWVAVGLDADSYFVYRNTGPSTASLWTLLRIDRVSGLPTVLASGNGVLSNASLGEQRLYATVLGSQRNRLWSVNKKGVPVVQTLEDTATSTYSVVQTSGQTAHQLFRVAGLGSDNVSYAVEMIDETGARLYATNVGGYPLSALPSNTVNFNLGDSRPAGFVFVSGYGVRAFSDTTLVAYNTATRAATVVGVLPGVAVFAQDPVFANISVGPLAAAGGFAGRYANGVVEPSGARVFSFDSAVAGSLKLALVP